VPARRVGPARWMEAGEVHGRPARWMEAGEGGGARWMTGRWSKEVSRVKGEGWRAMLATSAAGQGGRAAQFGTEAAETAFSYILSIYSNQTICRWSSFAPEVPASQQNLKFELW
jgi:hypothetical protein